MGHKHKKIPEISHYMTPHPHSIGSDQSLATAAGLMREHHIRHLPVLEGQKLTGMLSDRDLKFAMSFQGCDAQKVLVSEVATEEVYTAAPNTPLDAVLRSMSAGKIGSAVIMDNGKLVGIFTAVDAIEAFEELLETKLA